MELPARIYLPDLGSHTHTGALSSSSPPGWSSPDGCTQLWTGTGRAAGTGAPGAAHCAAALPSAPGPVFSLMRICVKEYNNRFPVYPQHSTKMDSTLTSRGLVRANVQLLVKEWSHNTTAVFLKQGALKQLRKEL